MFDSVKVSPYELTHNQFSINGYYINFRHDHEEYFSEVCLHPSLDDPSLEDLRSDRKLFYQHCFEHLTFNFRLIQALFHTSYTRIKKHHLLSFSQYLYSDKPFVHYKIKGVNKSHQLTEVLKKAQDNHHKIRLDFQNKLSRESFLQVISDQLPSLLRFIDYIEDPYEFDRRLWPQDSKKYNLCFAVDKNKVSHASFLRVYKPLHHKDEPEDGNYILSSLMGGYLSDALTMIFQEIHPSKHLVHGLGYSSNYKEFINFDGDDAYFIWNKKNKNLLISSLKKRNWNDL